MTIRSGKVMVGVTGILFIILAIVGLNGVNEPPESPIIYFLVQFWPLTMCLGILLLLILMVWVAMKH